jgi:NADH-quinone oxidoreductase subunit L
MGFAGAIITALYTSRMVLVTFFGDRGIDPTHRPGAAITIPLIVLAVLSFAGGFVELPHTMGHIQLFSGLVEGTLPALELRSLPAHSELILQIITGVTSLLAVGLVCFIYLRKPVLVNHLKQSIVARKLTRFWYSGWGFDAVYQIVFINPLVSLSKINKKDIMDYVSIGLSGLMVLGNRSLVPTQNGKLRWYMTVIVLGAILTLTISIII